MKDGLERKIEALTVMAANFSREFPEPLLKIWMKLLAPYPPAAVEAGVLELVRSYAYKTIPPFAVFQRVLDNAAGRIAAETSLEMAAGAEWARLLAAIERYGRYNPPRLHPTTAHVLRGMGGWDAACGWNTDKLEWRRKEFLEAWKLAHGREDLLELGAAAILAAGDGPVRVGRALPAILGKRPQPGAAAEAI